ncbi:MAG: hypothetical protein AAB250_04965, partial [Bdellovibrionota bacterium]
MNVPTKDRRHFLQLASLALADLALGGPVSCTTMAAVPPKYSSSAKGRVVLALRPLKENVSRIRIFDWDDDRFDEVEAPIGVVHSITQDDNDPNVLYLFEIFGSCVKFNVATKAFTKIDHRGKREMFNGHGALSHTGEFVACTEIVQDQGSMVSLRSSKDLSRVAMLPKECNNSHHVVSLPKTPLMAAGILRSLDGKEAGAITFYDTETRKVTNRIEFPFPVLHLMPLSSTEVIGLSLLTRWKRDDKTALSTERDTAQNIASFSDTQTHVPGPIYYATTDGRSETLWSEKDKSMFLDNFGLAKISGRSFLSGHHGSGKVILWEDLKMKKTFDVP